MDAKIIFTFLVAVISMVSGMKKGSSPNNHNEITLQQWQRDNTRDSMREVVFEVLHCDLTIWVRLVTYCSHIGPRHPTCPYVNEHSCAVGRAMKRHCDGFKTKQAINQLVKAIEAADKEDMKDASGFDLDRSAVIDLCFPDLGFTERTRQDEPHNDLVNSNPEKTFRNVRMTIYVKAGTEEYVGLALNEIGNIASQQLNVQGS